MWIVAVAVAIPDLAVRPVDEELATLVTGNVTGVISCLLLGIEFFGSTRATGTADGPPATTWYYMLIPFRHDKRGLQG